MFPNTLKKEDTHEAVEELDYKIWDLTRSGDFNKENIGKLKVEALIALMWRIFSLLLMQSVRCPYIITIASF